MNDRDTPSPMISVVVCNYNYAAYLPACLESVLTQTYAPFELIVVDDGSTDDSVALLEAMTDSRMRTLFKPNGGMASAFNAGFALTRGQVVIFLDADDALLPGALEMHAGALADSRVVRSQGKLAAIDPSGERTGVVFPEAAAAAGDLRSRSLTIGPGAYISVANSGNAWRRTFLEAVFPLPTQFPTLGAETFLMDTCPLFGLIAATDASVAAYRVHTASMTAAKRKLTLDKVHGLIDGHALRERFMARFARAQGWKGSPAEWRARNWRMLTLESLSARFRDGAIGPTLRAHLRATMRAGASPLKRAALMLAVLLMRALPRPAALALASSCVRPQFL